MLGPADQQCRPAFLSPGAVDVDVVQASDKIEDLGWGYVKPKGAQQTGKEHDVPQQMAAGYCVRSQPPRLWPSVA